MTTTPSSSLPALRTIGQRFIDPDGRQVILHGVNLVNKDPRVGYIGPETSSTFAELRRWGLNIVRLGVIWAGLEPEAGRFDDVYLDKIEQQVAWAGEHGLYVLLDMHQDLYSVLFSDGAPEWATLTGGQPHTEMGFVWDDAYFTSPAVQAALDNFWNNAPASDGRGLQEHYGLAWQAVARRFSGSQVIIGYDLMNEPFPGTAAGASQWLLFERGAQRLAEVDGPGAPSAEELAMQWLDPQGRSALLERLRDLELYTSIIDVTQPVYNDFEQQALMALYRRVSEAIRAVDGQHILFLESSMGSNMGVYSAIQPLEIDGQRDLQQAYAPHGYDMVVDTADIAKASPERVGLIFSRHAESARRHNWPMLVGEWGAYTQMPGLLPVARTVVGQLEQFLCGETYWHYQRDFSELSYFKAVQRPYPERVAGQLEGYHFDADQRTFTCTWLEDPAIQAPSRIYLPGWLKAEVQQILLTPSAEGVLVEPASEDGLWLMVPPTGQAMRRELKVRGGAE
jgi:endoglycosylceramidase